MIKPEISIVGILIVILILNAFFFIFIKSYKKYIVGQTGLFLLIIVSFIVFLVYFKPKMSEDIERERIVAMEQNHGELNINTMDYLFERKQKSLACGITLYRFLEFQTIVCFFSTMAGYYRTERKRLFKWTQVFYFFISFFLVMQEISILLTPIGSLLG